MLNASSAAISTQTTCTAVGGAFTAADCAIETRPLCDAARGNWSARDKFSLKNGMVGFPSRRSQSLPQLLQLRHTCILWSRSCVLLWMYLPAATASASMCLVMCRICSLSASCRAASATLSSTQVQHRLFSAMRLWTCSDLEFRF